MLSADIHCWRRGHGYYWAGAASARREDSKEARRLRTTSACSRLAPPGARSASIAERTACSEASVSAILEPSGECCGTSSRRAYSVCARSSARRWISDHRAAASAAASPPGASATLIASCRAEPFAYASTSLDRQLAAVAERRRAERAIKAIRPARTRTPSRTQSQIRLVPEEATGAAEAVAGGWVGGAAVTLGLAGAVAVRLGKLPIELLMAPPHPAASNPAASRVTGRESRFVERRMLVLRVVYGRPLDSPFCRRQGSLSRVPGRLGRPVLSSAGWLGGFRLRHHRDCAAPCLGSDLAISAPRSAAASCALAGTVLARNGFRQLP